MSEKKVTAPVTARIGRRGMPDTPMAEEEETLKTTSSVVVESPKRRKVEAGESEAALSTIAVHNRSSLSTPPQQPPCRKDLAAEGRLRISHGCVHAASTASSEEESSDGFKSADLEAGCSKCDNSPKINNVVSSPESEVCAGLTEREMESKSTASTQSRSVVYEAPTAEEIEEFFLVSENIEVQRFKEKYNYDVVNDVPVEGRFEWNRLQP